MVRVGMVRRPGVFAALVLPLALVVLGGCATTAEERQLASLSQGVEHDQKVIDRDAPLLGERGELSVKKPPARSNAAPTQGRSQTLGEGATDPQPGDGDGALNGDDPGDTTPRPVIRVVGVRRAQRGVHGLDQIEETLPDEANNGGTAGPPIRANAPAPSALDGEARRSYDAALALVNGHQYDQALDAFAAFLVRWPDHPNADNAMYWRGESYYAKGEYARAAEEFEGATLRFPLGNKVPDCLLKLGLCSQKLGNLPKAKTYFDRLLRDFPRSEAARRIPSERVRGVGPVENP